MSKKHTFLLLVILTAIFLTGCHILPYSNLEIRKYLWDEYGLWRVKLSCESGEQDGSRIWTVVDKKRDTTFHVYDNLYFDLTIDRSLYDDYEFALIMNNRDKLLEGYEDQFELIDNSDNSYYPVLLQFHYKNLADLRARCNDLEVIYKRLNKLNSHASITYTGILDFQRRELISSFCDEYILDDFEISSKIQYSDDIAEKIYEYIKLFYVWQAYNYQWPELLADVTEDDITKLLNDEDMICTTIVHSDDSEELVPGVISYSYWDLTYGNLYLFLKYCGFDVSGDATHYTVIAPSGIEYEFSYDFVDDEGAYILANGELTRLDSYDSYYVSTDEIEEFFGYKLYVRKLL
ncbi:hypothetical protein CIY_12410 [Butyrivibrio fibrisolvens 16/4]|nr:hypothetical protein CIY_12410 [Butyrivibrio fibrisolvens 16/4]